MTSEATALLRRYRCSAEISRPCERVLRWVAELDCVLRTPTPKVGALIDIILEQDARRIFFMLEGIFRLYRREYGGPAEALWAETKRLEDLIGAVDQTYELADAIRDRAVPPATLACIDGKVGKVRKRLARVLQRGWLADEDGWIERIAALLGAILALPWKDVESDVELLRREMARRLRKLEKADYDMDELEDGIHELRRQLRWLPISLTALDGIAVLDSGSNPIAAYEPLLEDPMAGSAYAELPASGREPQPFRLSRSLYVANTKIVAELGELKDRGELIDGLARALRKSGVAASKKKARKRALELLGLTAGDERRVHTRSAEILSELRELGLVRELRRQVAPA